MDDIAIKVEGVSKSFKLPHEKNSSIKGAFVNVFNGKRTFEKQQVLKDISFEIKKGEFFGIVGRNGSGKSTLLKLLAGIYSPDTGAIHINGKLTPFIELGVGFNPELTGRENVYLNGSLLGFNRKEMNAMYDEIVDFAELHKFMDQKLKNYSSGMQVRLAFSIAIRANTEILLLDEVLAVGDSNFQKKCFEYFTKIKNEKKTVILVTHDMGVANKYCDKAILIDKGDILKEGSTETVISSYNKINLSRAVAELQKQNMLHEKSHNIDNKKAYIKYLRTEDGKGKEKNLFKPNDKITFSCEINSTDQIKGLSIIFQCNNPGGVPIFWASTQRKKLNLDMNGEESKTIEWEIENILNDGSYLVSAFIQDIDNVTIYDQIKEGYKFEVSGWKAPWSIVHPKDNLKVKG